jgi:NADH:ubiquinone oxidoreductase subunit
VGQVLAAQPEGKGQAEDGGREEYLHHRADHRPGQVQLLQRDSQHEDVARDLDESGQQRCVRKAGRPATVMTKLPMNW